MERRPLSLFALGAFLAPPHLRKAARNVLPRGLQYCKQDRVSIAKSGRLPARATPNEFKTQARTATWACAARPITLPLREFSQENHPAFACARVCPPKESSFAATESQSCSVALTADRLRSRGWTFCAMPIFRCSARPLSCFEFSDILSILPSPSQLRPPAFLCPSKVY